MVAGGADAATTGGGGASMVEPPLAGDPNPSPVLSFSSLPWRMASSSNVVRAATGAVPNAAPELARNGSAAWHSMKRALCSGVQPSEVA